MVWNKDEIKSLRLRLGWTQSDLARRLHVSVQVVDLWEHGTGQPEASFQQDLELLSQQASFCSDELQALPAAESECDSSSVGQIEFSRVKGQLQ